MRNREIRLFLFIQSITCLAATSMAAFFFSLQAALFLFMTSAVFILTSFYFTKWRYREVEKLSSYLRKIANGDYSLDIRDNAEGELSILKNDIFKVTSMLSEQSTYLKEEKIRLKDAISDISHQLKTPLTSMIVMADLLDNPNLESARRKEFIHNIQGQLERIEWLVSSLLKLAKIEAEVVPFKRENASANVLVQKAVQSVLIPMDIKQISLKINGDENITFQVDVTGPQKRLLIF